MNYADRARQRQQKMDRATNISAAGARFNQPPHMRKKHTLHNYLLLDRGVSFGVPFDGVGLPSHNAIMMGVTEDGESPIAVFNLGYKQTSTFPKTLNPSQINQVTAGGDEIVITMPQTEQGIANAVGFYYGLDASISQHGKMFSTVPLKVVITKHFSKNATSDAFSVNSKYGRTRVLTANMNTENETSVVHYVSKNQMLNLRELTHALVKIPQPGEVDSRTGFLKQPQYMITDRVTIKLHRM